MALVFCVFVIRSFNYPGLVNCVQKLLSPDIFLVYLRILFVYLKSKSAQKAQHCDSLLFEVSVFMGYSLDAAPSNNEGRLY